MSNITEIDAKTGTSIEREYTAAELEQREADATAANRAAAEAAAKSEADAVATAAAIAHAKSLGFTDAMIAVMYPNLGSN